MPNFSDSVFLRRGVKASAWIFLVSLVFAVVDALGWLILPHPFRIVIPMALVLSTLVGITLLVGMLGIPKKP